LKNIYFVSESIPYPGYGSFVIFYRHLIRLENEGYRITLIIPDYKNSAADTFLEEIKDRWTLIKIPLNKWWFLLPYRYNYKILREIRFRFVYLYIKKHANTFPPDFIVSYFYRQFYNGLAVFLKKKFNSRLGVFLHDDNYLLNNNNSVAHLKYDQYISENADVIWTVSDRLFIPQRDKKKYKLLYPIPAGTDDSLVIKSWDDSYIKPVIGFSGSIYPEFESIFNLLATELKSYDGELILIIKNHNQYAWMQALAARHTNITLIESFADVNGAMAYLRDNCTALFCGYPDVIDRMPWITSCFPSKFVEFSHLGLPVILTSSPGTALFDWAVKYKWKLVSTNYSSADFKRIIKDITNENDWNENVSQTLHIANTIFDPENIHNEFLVPIRESFDK
jgi:hypothetical protein